MIPAQVIEQAAARYRPQGRWAHGFARGKMSGDPVYDAVFQRLPQSGLLLDVGCGEGYLLALVRALRPGLTLVGVDHDAPRLERARRALRDEPRLTLSAQDARAAGVPKADVICCLDVLHYMPPPQQDALIAALAGGLRPGGQLIIRDGQRGGGWRSVALRWSEQLAVWVGRHKGDGVFFRSAGELPAAMQAAGLVVQVDDCNQGTPFANLVFTGHQESP